MCAGQALAVLAVALALVAVSSARVTPLRDGGEGELPSLRVGVRYLTRDQLPARTVAEEELNDAWQRLAELLKSDNVAVSVTVEPRQDAEAQRAEWGANSRRGCRRQ